MTNLVIRKHDKSELQALIDAELAAYTTRTTAHSEDVTAKPDARGNYPRKLFLGAVVPLIVSNLSHAMDEVQRHSDMGYKIFSGMSLSHDYSPFGVTIYMSKPQAPQVDEAGSEIRVHDAVYQSDDLPYLIAEVTANYQANLDAHNDAVYVQEAEALRAEEAALAAQAQVDASLKTASEFDKRVRERMRGSRAGGKA